MRALVHAAPFWLVPALAVAQQTTGDVLGRILDGSGQPVGGAEVSATGDAIQGDRAVISDRVGNFRLLALPPGMMTLRVTRIGYRSVVIEGVEVRLGRTTALTSVILADRAAELPPLVVTADRATVDPRSTAIASELPSAVIERLPVSRDYAALVKLLPLANESYYSDGVNVAGGTGLENAYFLDGMNVTEPYRGDGGIDLPHNFIDHIQLRSGGYEAEYGRALGGVVNVVTRTGANEIRASAFGYFTTSGLASAPERGLIDRGRGSFTRYDVGLGLGGPIREDRLWYFLAYDAQIERERVAVPGHGDETDVALTQKFAAKLNWRADGRTDVALTIVGDPSTRDIVGNPFFAPLTPPDSLANPDPYLGVWNDGGVMAGLSGRRLIGQRMLLEGTLARTAMWFENSARTARGRSEPLFSDALTGVWSGGYGNFEKRTSVRSAASVAATFTAGEHVLRGGIQYEDNWLDTDERWQADAPEGAGYIERADSAAYVSLPLSFQGRSHNRVFSAFGQASYLAAPWLRLNSAIRWDGQFFSVPSGRHGAIVGQIQPRLGLVAYPARSARQKITASFGRFYEQLPSGTVATWWNGFTQDVFFYDHDPRADPAGAAKQTYALRAADRLRGQHYDEVTLGYERGSAGDLTVRLRGTLRMLREILTIADSVWVDPTSVTSLGANPGRDPAAFLPRPKATYQALELTAESLGSGPLTYVLSYVLSRHSGNYVGIFDQDAGIGVPHGGSNFMNPLELENADGLLPNDRTHVFKALGSYVLTRRISVGAQATIQSGTPLNYLGANPNPSTPWDVVFLKTRGTAGRTPWIWDLNLRVGFEVPFADRGRSVRIVLDAFHVLSEKRPVWIEQQAFLAFDPGTGQQTQPNPFYGDVLLRQQPMTLRVGLEVGG